MLLLDVGLQGLQDRDRRHQAEQYRDRHRRRPAQADAEVLLVPGQHSLMAAPGQVDSRFGRIPPGTLRCASRPSPDWRARCYVRRWRCRTDSLTPPARRRSAPCRCYPHSSVSTASPRTAVMLGRLSHDGQTKCDRASVETPCSTTRHLSFA